jgi:peptidoglycan/LPS O-acetylase OafA/YrhL
MPRLIIAFIIISIFFVIASRSHPFAFHYDWATALVYYPLWISGAWLAERYRTGHDVRSATLTSWRVGALSVLIATNQINLKSITIPGWLPFAAVGIFGWYYLPREFEHWARFPPPAVTERLGRASYSLYLLHILPVALNNQLPSGLAFLPLLAALSIAVGALTFCFYTLCERPAHLLARRVGRKRIGAPLVMPV